MGVNWVVVLACFGWDMWVMGSGGYEGWFSSG